MKQLDFEVLERSLFQGSDLKALSGYLSVVDIPAGQEIFREGDKGDFMGILIKGEIEIRSPQENRSFAFLRPAQSFGEMAIIDGGPRSATALATEPCRYLRLSKEDMQRMMGENHRMGMVIANRILRTLSLRLRAANSVLLEGGVSAHVESTPAVGYTAKSPTPN